VNEVKVVEECCFGELVEKRFTEWIEVLFFSFLGDMLLLPFPPLTRVVSLRIGGMGTMVFDGLYSSRDHVAG